MRRQYDGRIPVIQRARYPSQVGDKVEAVALSKKAAEQECWKLCGPEAAGTHEYWTRRNDEREEQVYIMGALATAQLCSLIRNCNN